MCGLLGVVNLKGKGIDIRFFESLLNSLDHRGPDSKGLKKVNNVIFGNTRLSIIGVEEKNANLPISDNKNILCFNGEIYNYKKLNKILNKNKIYSSGNSDSETLFLFLKNFGLNKTLSLIDGMYAFAYYDYKKNHIYLARDRIGERFLYYTVTSNSFIFASEIKTILKSNILNFSPNLELIKDYFFTSKINGSNTMFKQVKEIEAGTYLSYDISNSKVQIRKYWDLEKTFIISKSRKDLQSIEESTMQSINQAVSSRLVSDVPITFLLSGGIDSQALLERALNLNIIDKIHIYFADNLDKNISEKADLMQGLEYLKKKYPDKKLNLFSKKVSYEKYMKELDDLIWYYDEPIQFVNSVLLSHLCRQIKQNKQKVAWSGEGSDEIFYGYNRFINSSNLFSIKDNQDAKIGNIYYGGGLHSLPIIDRLTNKKEIANEKELDAWTWLRKNVDKDFDILQQMYSQKYRLQMLLQRQDRIGMKHSVEIRTPYLSPDLVAFANKLNLKYKFDKKRQITKLILKNIFKNKLASRILTKKKDGFPSDMLEWIKQEMMYKLIKKVVTSKNSFSYSYLDGKIANQILNDHYNKSKDYSTLIWMLYSLELWHKKFF
tara:strand:+ start:7192 stop:9003 length:1812 start_codon:yes stop_codon:yes gene_type:complete